MNKRILTGLLGVMVAGGAQASLYSYDFTTGFNNSGVIPDGNVAGWADTRTVDLGTLPSGVTTEIVDVNVRLHITGGYNGDLYGYLVHSSGFAVLLNRIGRTATDSFGNTGAGMDVTLSDNESYVDIHGAGFGVLGGTYESDGRNVDPATVLNTDTRQNGDNPLGVFNTLSANGDWTLFLADLAGGDTSTLVSWGLDITVVPEPTEWALIIFATLAVFYKFVLPRLRKAQPKTGNCL